MKSNKPFPLARTVLTYAAGKDASTDAFHACGEDTPIKEYQCSGLGCRPRVRGRCPARAEGEVKQGKIIYIYKSLSVLADHFTLQGDSYFML